MQLAGFTVKSTAGAVAAGRLEVTVKVGFVNVPASVARRFTETVHTMPAATVPAGERDGVAACSRCRRCATALGLHVRWVSATASPAGRVSVKARPVATMPLAELSIVTVARVDPALTECWFGREHLGDDGRTGRVHGQIDRRSGCGGKARGDGEGRVRQRARLGGAQVHRNRARPCLRPPCRR